MPKGRERARKWDDPGAPRPTIGPQVCDWMEHYLVHGPGDVQGRPFRLHDDLRAFVWMAYELRPKAGTRFYEQAALVLPKGVAKSEAGGALACAEGLGPVRFDGWDASGNPVAAPVRQSEILIFGEAEDQANNTYTNVSFMLGPDTCADALMAEYGAIDIGRHEETSTKTILPAHRGAIEQKTSAPRSKEGGKTTFVVIEEPGLWVLPKSHLLYDTIARNLLKRVGTWGMLASNWFEPGAGSVLERVHQDAVARMPGLLWFARQVPLEVIPTNVPLRELDDATLRKGLKAAYGSATWVDPDRIISYIRKPSTDDGQAKRFFFNRGESSVKKWRSERDWSVRRSSERLQPGDVVALGFDGSRRRDATVLVATRLRDRLQQPLAVWERPEGAQGEGWEVTSAMVDVAIDAAFTMFRVARMYADPPYWQSDIERWQLRYGDQVVLAFHTSRDRMMGEALERYDTEFDAGHISHTGDDTMTRHVLNAEKDDTSARVADDRRGYRLVKPAGIDPDSYRAHIDCAVAAVISHEAACDAIADGALAETPKVFAY